MVETNKSQKFDHQPFGRVNPSYTNNVVRSQTNLSAVRSLPFGPRGLRVRRLPWMQEVVGSNPTEVKICFSQFTPFYEVECEKLFCKINFKI